MAYLSLVLALGAFWLGACPFSLWIGWLCMGKDIRSYGDGNPGAANVFRAGGQTLAWLAVLLDTAKGIPFVLLAHSFFALPEASVMVIMVCAITGSSFSPFLNFKGGKSVAVTFGTLLGLLPEGELLLLFIAFVCIGALLMSNHAWVVMSGPVGSLVYLLITGATLWKLLFMLCILLLLGIKHQSSLKSSPGPGMQPVIWIRARKGKA
jgi:acyl phosphate:glycerol-3-phosphate acyltransferase